MYFHRECKIIIYFCIEDIVSDGGIIVRPVNFAFLNCKCRFSTVTLSVHQSYTHAGNSNLMYGTILAVFCFAVVSIITNLILNITTVL